MKRKNVSSKHPAAKAESSLQASESRRNPKQKKPRNSQQSIHQRSQAGFSEPGSDRRRNVDYSDVTIGIP